MRTLCFRRRALGAVRSVAGVWTSLSGQHARATRVVLAGIAIVTLSACHGLLDVSDPTLIRDQDVANAGGANGRRLNAESAFLGQTARAIMDVAYFTDEIAFDARLANLGYSDKMALDQRNGDLYAAHHQYDDPHLGTFDWIVTSTSLAIPQVRSYSPADLRGDFLGQLFAYRGYAIVQMAENVCPGFPINDITVDNVSVLSGPYSTDSALTFGISQLDSALADVVDSTSYRYVAQVAKGRALLDLQRYDQAAAAVSGVPTDFVYTSNPNYGNGFYVCPTCKWNFSGMPMGDGEGHNGLHFVSEHDLIRSPSRYMRQRFNDTTVADYASTKYATSNATYTLVSGTEARLIESEVALHNHDDAWLTILNALRTPAGLDPLVDPGTDSARVDLVYHERAFWMYLTGRRLGDLRRLIRNYGRHPESIFPTGQYPLGGSYGTATAIPFSFVDESAYNPKITAGCTTP